MSQILEQLKKRRLELGLKQNDMPMRIGVSRQQYQRLESKGNPRLDTLELVAKGLNSELVLVPRSKLDQVKAVLENTEKPTSATTGEGPSSTDYADDVSFAENPWQGLLGDEK